MRIDSKIKMRLPWADAADAGRLEGWAWAAGGWVLRVVRRRWVVKRALAWLSRRRRLSKDYEQLPETGEAWVHIAVVHLMLKSLEPT